VRWNPPHRTGPARADQEEAAEITGQASGAGAETAGEDVSDAAQAGTDAAAEVEAAGRFRVYLGAAPGVGKTYAMLSEGHRRQGRGADVVAGFVESYGRPLTEALVNGLEVIPRQTVDYGGARLEEMDVDAVLRRRPGVALIDELAHTNVRGRAGTANAGRTSGTSSARESTSSPPSTFSTSRASPTRSSR
jgi:Osmosensitive K+ channel His kinase sensor domain